VRASTFASFVVNQSQPFPVAPESRVNAKVELSAQVSAQDSQVAWQPHLTLPYSQYFEMRSAELFFVNQSQSCTFPLSRENLKAASSVQDTTTGAEVGAMVAALVGAVVVVVGVPMGALEG